MHDKSAKRPYWIKTVHLTEQPELRLVGWLALEAGALRCYVAICGAVVGGSSQWSAALRNPLFWKPCFRIGGQPNWLGGALRVRRKLPFVRVLFNFAY